MEILGNFARNSGVEKFVSWNFVSRAPGVNQIGLQFWKKRTRVVVQNFSILIFFKDGGGVGG